jgi:hypothetical protein
MYSQDRKHSIDIVKENEAREMEKQKIRVGRGERHVYRDREKVSEESSRNICVTTKCKRGITFVTRAV